MNRDGEGAHWAAVVGYFVVEKKEEVDEGFKKIELKKVDSEVKEQDFYVIAYQGKSK